MQKEEKRATWASRRTTESRAWEVEFIATEQLGLEVGSVKREASGVWGILASSPDEENSCCEPHYPWGKGRCWG